MATHAWQDIRALRAAPTGLAAGDEKRRAVFVAALTQAEELARAADVAGYAAMPLPLFYALSQAGRAIAAAHKADPWEPRSHGLGFSFGAASNTPLLDAKVEPHSTGSYPIVSEAVGSPPLTRKAPLGALWAANPDLQHVEMKGAEGQWLRCLDAVFGARTEDPQSLTSPGPFTSADVSAPGGTGQQVAAVLSRYPTLAGVVPMASDGQGHRPAAPNEPVREAAGFDDKVRVSVGKPCDPGIITMQKYWVRLDSMFSVVEVDHRSSSKVAPTMVGIVLPPVAGGTSPSPLMLWWALLLGLSSLARYYPAQWSAAIDPNSSVLAVPLEQVLQVAAEHVPARILAALEG